MDQGYSGAIQGQEYRPPLHLVVVAIEKGDMGSPSIMITNFTYIYNIYIYIIYIYIVRFINKEWSSIYIKFRITLMALSDSQFLAYAIIKLN